MAEWGLAKDYLACSSNCATQAQLDAAALAAQAAADAAAAALQAKTDAERIATEAAAALEAQTRAEEAAAAAQKAQEDADGKYFVGLKIVVFVFRTTLFCVFSFFN